jgi:L,D-transpeptidase catalytic domain
MCKRSLTLVGSALLITVCAGLAAPADAAVLITVDKSAQQMTVEVDGALRWTWPVSTGRLGYDTPSGRYTSFRMEAEHFSKEWDDAPMPHSIFFTQKGHAIHGYLDTRQIGRAASHGCVRLTPGNATALFALVREQGMSNTKVVITGDVRASLAPRTPTPRRDTAAGMPNTPPLGYAAPPPSAPPQPYGYYGYAPAYRYVPPPSYQPVVRPYTIYRTVPYGF